MGGLARVGIAVSAAAIFLLATAPGSAGSPGHVITMRQPFVRYGALNESGNRTTAYHNANPGGSAILVTPSFNTTTGHVDSGLWSVSLQGGTTGLESWAGVYNLTFACARSCATGSHDFVLSWNLSWAAFVSANCSYYYSSGTWARAGMEVVGSVYNITSGSHSLVGTSQTSLFRLLLATPSYFAGVNGTKLVRLGMNLSLVSGSSYEIETLVFLHTWAHSKGGCGSRAAATISSSISYLPLIPPSNSSRLVSIRVS